jgi:hypothetical protein
MLARNISCFRKYQQPFLANQFDRTPLSTLGRRREIARRIDYLRPTMRMLRSRVGVKSLARISNTVGEIFFTPSPQKLTMRSGWPLSMTRWKALIGPAQLAPVFNM